MRSFKDATKIISTLALDPLLPAYAAITYALAEKTAGLLVAYGDSGGNLILPQGLKVTGAATFSGATTFSSTLTAFNPQAVIAGDGAVTVAAGTTFFTKGSAAAITLAAPVTGAPAAGQDGMRITLTSGSSFAHVVTATSLIEDGATGVPHTTLTFAAFVGASITLEAHSAKWYVVANNGVTVS